MTSDMTFITNEDGNKLVDRFNDLIRDTQFFDCLVGYFYSTGFHSLYKSLENTERIRILIGISTDPETFRLIKKAQQTLNLSYKETKEHFSDKIVNEMDDSEDNYKVEEGIRKFLEWLQNGKLEIRVYPVEKIHAKLYIMSFKEGHIDKGRVITGSSNFTRAGFKDNLEFNVELKNRSDYEFSREKFNLLWDLGVDVSEEYVTTVSNKTWLNETITPYELYLKFLYEYLKEQINIDKEKIQRSYLPDGFMELQYQMDAVKDAKMKLDEYNGVFISDVVGLGKTYICALLAQQLKGRTLVIAPPILINRDNPGSWPNVFGDFGVRGPEFESRGKLEHLLERGVDKYQNIIIDEAHDFRNEATLGYEKLSRICKGKKVILVSATPMNNTPRDILSQIKLFQKAHKSTLPHPEVRDLENYFNKLENRLKPLDRKKNREEYIKIVQENADNVREKILKYIMVRRTRSSINKYYGKDLEKQGLKFPKVDDPKQLYYNFDEELNLIFNKTLELITTGFIYARYTPLLYLKRKLNPLEIGSQRNMGKFMKILLLKRLESSFHAFKQSVKRFIYSYENFIGHYRKGQIYVSKKYTNKIFDLLENDDLETVEKMISEGKAVPYQSSDFDSQIIKDLEHDLKLLKEIHQMWKGIEQDPKLDKFIEVLRNDKNLRRNRLLVFTESKETAFYLEKKLNPLFNDKVLAFSGDSPESDRLKIIKNFDANERNPQNDYHILISTDVLSQGVNLHRSNVVINYDIPWNPTRMMQRVGRVQRVDTKFDEIFIYNFFPAGQINENISLQEAAESKIAGFIEMLGNDSKLLTDEEIKTHELFNRLTSKETITGEEEEEDYELKYLTLMRDIRDEKPELFEKIKRLPKKARTARRCQVKNSSLLTFFRSGNLRKIYQTQNMEPVELDFLEAAEILESKPEVPSLKITAEFYKHLNINKKEFESVFDAENEEPTRKSGRSHETYLSRIIKATIGQRKGFTEIDEDYLKNVLDLLDEGTLPPVLLKNLKKELNKIEGNPEPFKILNTIKNNIPIEYFEDVSKEHDIDFIRPKEVILSEYLINGD
ncbi:MAG: helicase [Methanobacterium sp.]|nr:MAG: helicase [Methanobacterium sp.]